MIFIADLIACSTCFGHHYAHHQELESIIQVVAACAAFENGLESFQLMGRKSVCLFVFRGHFRHE
jgi:hypothetical protein